MSPLGNPQSDHPGEDHFDFKVSQPGAVVDVVDTDVTTAAGGRTVQNDGSVGTQNFIRDTGLANVLLENSANGSIVDSKVGELYVYDAKDWLIQGNTISRIGHGVAPAIAHLVQREVDSGALVWNFDSGRPERIEPFLPGNFTLAHYRSALFDDQVAVDIAALLADEPTGPPLAEGGLDLVVFGAHLRGEPLNHQLTERGARFVDDVATSDAYRMYALPTHPPKPAIVSVGPGAGASLRGERWRLSPAALGTFLAALPAPMALGAITLADGSTATGFLAPASAVAGGDAPDITESAAGSWRTHLAGPG